MATQLRANPSDMPLATSIPVGESSYGLMLPSGKVKFTIACSLKVLINSVLNKYDYLWEIDPWVKEKPHTRKKENGWDPAGSKQNNSPQND